jgi:tyrosyl-tRNA synthetase
LQRSNGQESQVVLTMPILEGLDGVQKMSKSLGNAIGIQEAPLDMYGKLMSISDEMMWRYYELLTDVQVADIEKMKRESHPMQAKKDLAQRIVKDFHSAEAAAKAAEDWAKQFQKNETPESIEQVDVALNEVKAGDGSGAGISIRVDKLVHKAGLATSATDAQRRREQGAVKVNGEPVTTPVLALQERTEIDLRVGKGIKRVRLL